MKKVIYMFASGVQSFYNKHIFVFLMLMSLILNISIECLGRRSLFSGISYVLSRPLIFSYNALIICMTLSVCLLFRRRTFILVLVSIFWVTCGIVNCVLLGFRTTPFSAVDLQILSSVFGIIEVYLNGWQFILICIAIAAALAGLVWLWIKAPKVDKGIPYVKSASVIAAIVLSVVIIDTTAIAAETSGTNYPNIADAYEDFGFAYCFSNSIIDHGISRPEGYSEEKMYELRSTLDKIIPYSEPAVTPNIIMVQLESFFDVKNIKGLELSEDPIPVFTSLKKNFSTGYLTVPSIGAGTANTEFEIISGISLDFFGASEYPYKTVLKEKTCESICFDLKDYGYSAHAIHNNDGTFYDRHIVFPNLGFDSFTSVEYMDDVSYNALGWVDDNVLLKEITDSVTLTDTKDFVYAITVQSHGKYPTEVLDDAPYDIKIADSGFEMSDELINATEYYINQIHEVDNFVGDLIAYFENFDEPTVIVFYGDHLPNLNLTKDMLVNGDLLQTEYIMWSNYDLDNIRKNLSAFQLSSYVTERLGINGGYINTYNKYFDDTASYPSQMQYLGYDMLFGNRFIYGGDGDDDSYGKYAVSEINMGVRDITVKNISASINADKNKHIDLIIKGLNFTEFSVVTINNKKQETVFVGSDELMVYDISLLADGDSVSVVQIGDDNEILSTSDGFVWGGFTEN